MMAADRTGRAPWRVLIVDDEENLNWSLVTSLRKDGYIVDGAHTGEEALARLRSAPYDCVVSDIKMPGMDGFELLQWLRQHHPATHMVMITSFGSPSARQDALREGAVAYFEKPFDLRALKDQLRRMSEKPVPAMAPEAGYDLLDVAQVISLARRDIALDVRGGGYVGVLRFLQGELLWAEAGDLRGDEAFLALCVPRGGHAQVAAWNGLTGRNVTQPVARLIYGALTRRESRTGAPARQATEPPTTAQGAAMMYALPPRDNEPDEQPAAGTSAQAPALAEAVESNAAASHPVSYGEAIAPIATVATVATVATAVPLADPPTGEWSEAARADAPLPASADAVDGADGPEHPPLPDPALPDSAASPPAADPIAALEGLADALPAPCGVAWIGSDAELIWQRWRGQAEIPQAALTPLHMAVRAAGQASALGELGALDELRIVSAERLLILRRGPRGGTLLLSLTPNADAGAVTAALHGALDGLMG